MRRSFSLPFRCNALGCCRDRAPFVSRDSPTFFAAPATSPPS